MLNISVQQNTAIVAHECGEWISAVARDWYALESYEFPKKKSIAPELVTGTLYEIFMASERIGLADGAARILLGFDLLRAFHYGYDFAERKKIAQFFFSHALNQNAEYAHDWLDLMFEESSDKEAHV